MLKSISQDPKENSYTKTVVYIFDIKELYLWLQNKNYKKFVKSF